MSNITVKKKIKGYECTINWFCVGKFDTLTITIDKFDKVLGSTTDRRYVEKMLGIEDIRDFSVQTNKEKAQQ